MLGWALKADGRPGLHGREGSDRSAQGENRWKSVMRLDVSVDTPVIVFLAMVKGETFKVSLLKR